MTILDALEKAKRMRSEKAAVAVDQERVQRSPQVRRAKLEVALAPVAALNFPRLTIDLAGCERNRVLISAQPGSSQARAVDSYRILRTRLRNRLVVDQSTSFGLVSAGPDEGKSLTAINLALAFASEKRRNVFLLDLDLRNPSLCRYLGVTPKGELANCLAHTTPPEDIFFTVGIDNLIIAGGLSSHDNSSELLGGSGLAALMDYIRKCDPHALMIVDLPPLLQSADAMVVAPHMTSMVLVVGEGLTRRDQLNRAAELLAGTNIAGVVLNRSREAIEAYYG
jgi:Mrp family chromosome partitioning ATPase